jgi:hypothetical protein
LRDSDVVNGLLTDSTHRSCAEGHFFLNPLR